MTERRYSEDEVAAIFRKAAEDETTTSRPVASEGMTLRELQGIGQEVGIAPALVELGRRLTDEEWDQLVVALRETFNARGQVSVQGSLRQWTNGNLQALLEPTPTGDRLRLRTTNGNASALMRIGIATLVAAGAVLFARWTGGSLAQALPGFTILAATGIGAFAAGALRLPGWARLRARQMEGIGAQLSTTTLLEPPAG